MFHFALFLSCLNWWFPHRNQFAWLWVKRSFNKYISINEITKWLSLLFSFEEKCVDGVIIAVWANSAHMDRIDKRKNKWRASKKSFRMVANFFGLFKIEVNGGKGSKLKNYDVFLQNQSYLEHYIRYIYTFLGSIKKHIA